MAGTLEGDYFVGKKAEELRGLLKIKYPIVHGAVQDWNDMENIWNYTYIELKCRQEEVGVYFQSNANQKILASRSTDRTTIKSKKK